MLVVVVFCLWILMFILLFVRVLCYTVKKQDICARERDRLNRSTIN